MRKHYKQSFGDNSDASYWAAGEPFSRKYLVETEGRCGYTTSGIGKLGRLGNSGVKHYMSLTGKSGTRQIIEIGCGTGDLAAHLVEECNVSATLVDREFSLGPRAQALYAAGRMNVIIKPAEQLYPEEIPSGLSGLVAQRSLHWLPWKNAKGLLRRVGNRMTPGARIFLSLADINGALGENYPLNEQTPLERRYAIARTPDPAYRHPVTLYTSGEAVNLVTENGFRLNEISQTTWGSHVIVATRTSEAITKNQIGYRQTPFAP